MVERLSEKRRRTIGWGVGKLWANDGQAIGKRLANYGRRLAGAGRWEIFGAVASDGRKALENGVYALVLKAFPLCGEGGIGCFSQ